MIQIKLLWTKGSIRRFMLLALLMMHLSAVPAGAEIGDLINQQGDDLLYLKDIEKPETKGKWVPVPVPVSNPTVGHGLMAGLLYLHPEKDENPDGKSPTTGIGGMYTDSKSWFAGVFHDNNWFSDRLRFTAFAGTGELNLKYYGVGPDSIFKTHPIPYKIKPDAYMWKLLGEPIKNSDWYVGVSHLYTTADVVFKTSEVIGLLPDIKGNLTTSGLGLVVTFDSRDNSYYPSGGSLFEVVISFDDPNWGSDFTYQIYSSFYTHYFPVINNGILALRVDMGMVDGDVPFYMLPSLSMRGFSAGRYSDEVVLSGHAEWRHKFLPRWGYILSYESGYTNDSVDGIFNGQYAYSLGAGLRWQVLSSEKLHLGLDFGINEDDRSLCVQVGERF